MSTQVTRRSVLKLSLAAAGSATALGSMTACSPSSPSSAEATWSMWSSSANEAKVWEDFSRYVESSMGVKSIPNLTPSNGYQTKLDLQLVSGTASKVTAVNGWLLPTYAARGALLPLDDLIASDPEFDPSDFYESIRSISSFNNSTYAVGFDVAPVVMYYNKTLFEKHGVPLPSPTVPMTWDQFRDSAVEFSKTPDEYGFTCAPLIDDLVSWLYSAGGNVMNEGQTASGLSSDESMYAMQFVMDLFVKYKATPPIKSLVTENALSNFLQGNVAYMQNGPWQVVNARKAKFEWDIIPFPAGPAGSLPRVSGSSFAIPAGTKDVKFAWDLLKTLTSRQALDIYAKAGRNNPARRSSGTAFAPPPANLGIVQQILAGELAGGHPYEVSTNWNEVRLLLGQDLPRGFLGQLTPQEAVKRLTPDLNVLMRAHQDTLRQLA